MKSLSWFRLYAEAIDDEKLRLLAFEDRWHFVALLCCKAAGILEGEDAELRRRKVQIKLGLGQNELGEVLRRLAEVGLICAETMQPLAWDHRQRKSDHDDRPPERLREWREKKRTGSEPEVNRKRTGNEPRPETETETETEKEEAPTVLCRNDVSTDSPQPVDKSYKLPACPYSELVARYHERLPVCPRVEVLSEQRKRHLQARWRQVCADEKLTREQGLEWFDDFFANVAKSQFLTGKTKPRDGRRPFFASLDWLMSPEKFVHVYEGRYS